MKKVAVVLVALMLCGAAQAALDTSNAWTDPQGTTWTGTVTFDLVTANTVAADVEYCVEWVPSLGQFKYTYQMTNTGSAPLTELRLNMRASNEAVNIFDVAGDGDVAVSSSQLTVNELSAGSAIWYWQSPAVQPGELTSYVGFYSVNAPTWGSGADLSTGSIFDDGGSDIGFIPTPGNEIPEPATLSLLAITAVGLIRRRK